MGTKQPTPPKPVIDENFDDMQPDQKTFLAIDETLETTRLEGQENLQFALALGALGFRVFPCQPFDKAPLTSQGFIDATTDERQIKNWFHRWPNANLALATGLYSGQGKTKCLVVLDFDSKFGDPNQLLVDLENSICHLPETTIVHTPNGGFHLYFQTTEKINSSVSKLAVGLDVRAIGGYVLLPPSRLNTKIKGLSSYVWHNQIGIHQANIAVLPKPWVNEILASEARAPSPSQDNKNDQTTKLVRYARGETINEESPIFEGQRNDALARLGFALRRRSVSQSTIRNTLVDENNLRCKPPLDPKEVEKIIQNVCRYKPMSHVTGAQILAKNKTFEVWGGMPSPSQEGHLDGQDLGETQDGQSQGSTPQDLQNGDSRKTFFDDKTGACIDSQENAKPLVSSPIERASEHSISDWHKMLLLSEKGKILPCLANVELILAHSDVFRGAIWFDEIRQEIRVTDRLAGATKSARLSDQFEVDVTIYLQRKLGVMASVDTVHHAILAIGQRVKRNPVVDQIETYRFSGECWLDRWLVELFGVEDKPIYRAFGRIFILGLVARAYLPGIKFDTVLVLSGLQGAGKSSAFRILGGDFFTDDVGDFSDKDTKSQVARNWLVELAELGALRSSEVEVVKAFITRQVDQFRPPYGRNVIDVPRHCAFVATTNADQFLRDSSGNRRFQVVRVGPKVDLEKLREIRESLFAEAREILSSFHPIKKNVGDIEKFLVLDPELWQEAAEIAQETSVEDPWQETIAKFMSQRIDASLDAIFDELGVKVERRTRAEQMRIASICRVLGYEKTRRQANKVQTTYYVNKDAEAI